MDLRELNKIYILESPSEADIEENRMEGIALSEILNLAQIQNKYFLINSYEEIEEAFNLIVTDIKEINGSDNPLGTATLHFSMHGNEDGMGFTDNDFFDWEKLASLLSRVNQEVGYLPFNFPNNKRLSPLGISFSVCEGLNAKKVNNFSQDYLYTALVGPSKPVNWADSLLAYSVFYHNTLQKRFKFQDAVRNMNSSVGLENIFQVDLAAPLQFK